ncbi:plasma membrane fusion protein prm1 [Coemansia sp. Benny D115]|nr:plasma membrane fusion protein prm1 [Coemansia sp. Benny D115]
MSKKDNYGYPEDKKNLLGFDDASNYDTESEYDRYSILPDPIDSKRAYGYGNDKKDFMDNYPGTSAYPNEKAEYKPEKSAYDYPAEKTTYPNEKSTYPNEKSAYPNEKSAYGYSAGEPSSSSYPKEKAPIADPGYKVDDYYDDQDGIVSPVKRSNSGKKDIKGKAPAVAPVPIPAPAPAKDTYYDDDDYADNYYSNRGYQSYPEDNDNDNDDKYVDVTDKVYKNVPKPRQNDNYQNDKYQNDKYQNDDHFYASQYQYQDPPNQYNEKEKSAGYGNAEYRDNRGKQIMPYVGKWAIISRSWATQSVILLVFMGLGYILLAEEARKIAQEAVGSINSACLAVENASETVVNSPRSVALSTLTMIESSARSLIRVTYNSLNKLLTLLQTLIVWILKMYFGTYICIAEVIIQTALSVVAEVGQIMTDLLNKAVDAVVGNLQNTAATIGQGLQDGINGFLNVFTGGSKQVDFNVDDIRKELDITIPDDWVNSIRGLSDKIPTEDQIFGNITALLDIPFGMLRDVIFKGFNNIHINIVDNVKLPDEKNLTMCENPIGQDTIEDVGDAAATIFYIGGLAIIGFAVALIIFNVIMLMRSHRKDQERMLEFRQDLADYRPPIIQSTDEISKIPVTRQEMDFFRLPGNPWLNRITRWHRRKYGDTEKAAAWRWYIDYILYPPALACLLAGIIGIIAIVVQTNAINGLRTEFTPRLARDFDYFQNNYLGDQVLGGVRNDSINMATDMNRGILSSEDSLNRTMFAPINEGTSSLNDTLNGFIDKYISGIRSVFGGTPLQQPIEGLVNCTLTKHINSIQKVLTFVNEYAGGVDLPKVDNDTLYAPVAALMKPVNKTVGAMRVLLVGDFVPNATLLDAERFPTEKELKASIKEEERESKASVKSEEEESRRSLESVEGLDDDDDDDDSMSGMSGMSDMSDMSGMSDMSDMSGMSGMSDANDMDAISGLDGNLLSGNPPALASANMRKRQEANIGSSESESEFESENGFQSSSESSSSTNTSGSSSGASSKSDSDEDSLDVPNIATVTKLPIDDDLVGTKSSSSTKSQITATGSHSLESDSESMDDDELGNLDSDEWSSSYDYDALPSDLSKEDVLSAQKFGGYTGGVVGKLCDRYVASLQDKLPTMYALIGVWFVIATVGLFHVWSDYNKIAKNNRY